MLWLKDGQFKALQALVRDPVSRMLVDPADAPASIARDAVLLLLARLPRRVLA